jgi:hypothetical protein
MPAFGAMADAVADAVADEVGTVVEVAVVGVAADVVTGSPLVPSAQAVPPETTSAPAAAAMTMVLRFMVVPFVVTRRRQRCPDAT